MSTSDGRAATAVSLSAPTARDHRAREEDIVSSQVWQWSLDPPRISADLVLRLQKYHDPGAVPRAIREVAEAVVVESATLTSPEATVWRGPVTAVDTDAVTLDGGHRFHSRVLSRLLASSPTAYVVVLTIGESLERRTDELFADHQPLEALLLDTAGWAAIVVLMRQLRLRLRAREGLVGSVTHRLAPGYCDWPVEEQAGLLAVFGDARVPVRVTETAWMLPRKSMSGIFGVVARPAALPARS